MKKTIYLVRHSGPFVPLQIENKVEFKEQSKNMILSIEAEDKAKRVSKIKELQNIDEIYSSNSARAIATAKYIAFENNLDIIIDNNFPIKSTFVTVITFCVKFSILNIIVNKFN